MAVTERSPSGLQTIFAFFLGLMTLAFIGVGVNTFYSSPIETYNRQEREISREMEALNRKAAPGSFTAEQQVELDRLSAELAALNERQQADTKNWARVTSIIVVLFSTLVLVIALLLGEQIRVIANGLLLGGLFSMVYGVGWVLFSGNSQARFWVIVFALAVALALGYQKFVRGRRTAASKAGVEGARAGSPGGAMPADYATPAELATPAGRAGLAELTARVAALEARAAAAAIALRGEDEARKA